MADPTLREAMAKQEVAFNGEGRLLIRASGTEPLIRVMAEAKTRELAESVVDAFVDLVNAL